MALLLVLLGAFGLSGPRVAGADPPASAVDPAVEAARQWHRFHEVGILRDFAALLRLPNVAGDRQGIEANAEAILARLLARGVEAELLRLPEAPEAPPLIFGEIRPPWATRTVGIYVHYDGQPVVPEEWTFGPWEPTLASGPVDEGGHEIPWQDLKDAVPEGGADRSPDERRLYARAAGDDKAPLAALFAALDALAQAQISPTVNVKLLFEGEEEAGSPHLGRYFETYRDLLDVDLWLICDGPLHQSRRPQLVFGVRGYTGAELTVYGARRPLHSGHYGNWAPNPALELARLLASMKDAEGNVLIEGFYDSVEPLGPGERAALEALPDVDSELRRDLALAASEGDGSLAQRLLQPSLNIRGVAGGAVGAQARNLIPTQATASLDIRLVAGNDPEAMLDLLGVHLRRQGYHVVADEPDRETRAAHPRLVRFERRPGYPAARTPLDQPEAATVVAAARRVAGGELILMPTLGGSLPLYLFTEPASRGGLGRPVVIVPIANHDNNQHGPDENLRLQNLWYGIELMAALLTQDAS